MSERKHQLKHRKAVIVGAIGATVAANAYMHHQGYTIPGRTVARCSKGHEFTTLWIAGASPTSLRLTPGLRIQRCPECHAWRMVRPVKPGEAKVEVEVETAA